MRASLAAGGNVSFVIVRDAAIAGEITLFGIDVSSIGMCIAPDVRGMGWGGVLLDAVLGYAVRTGRPLLSLSVYAHNVAARRLYASRGFVAVGEPTATPRLDGKAYATIAMQRLMAGPVRCAVIAVDGTDGAGKTAFAAELAHELTRRGRTVIRASVDDFHHPRAVRYRRGRTSPAGFFEDSYDYAGLKRWLLEPLGPHGDGRFRRALHDVRTDESIDDNGETAPPGAVLLLEGIFLHRDELRTYWHYSVFLDVAFAVSIPRGAARDGGDPDPASPYNRRYVEGQRIYFARCRPRERASIVIDNTVLDAPRVV